MLPVDSSAPGTRPTIATCFAAPKLKLFKTTSGFKDSYVALISRAKALEAWGGRTDLFAMGAAEEIDDPAILREAASTPVAVLQRSGAKSFRQTLAGPQETEG